MIVEFSKLSETTYILPQSLKFTKKLETDLLNKIKAKKKEPFASIIIFVYSPIFPKLVEILNKEQIKIKEIIGDKIKIGIRL